MDCNKPKTQVKLALKMNKINIIISIILDLTCLNVTTLEKQKLHLKLKLSIQYIPTNLVFNSVIYFHFLKFFTSSIHSFINKVIK